MIKIELKEKELLLVLKVLNEFCKNDELDIIERDDIKMCIDNIISSYMEIVGK